MSFSEVREALRREERASFEAKAQVASRLFSNYTEKNQALVEKHKQARIERLGKAQYFRELLQEERQHRENQLDAMVEQERLKTQLRRLNNVELEHVRAQQERNVKFMEEEQKALEMQEADLQARIQSLEAEIAQEDLDIHKQRQRLAGAVEDVATSAPRPDPDSPNAPNAIAATRLHEMAMRPGDVPPDELEHLVAQMASQAEMKQLRDHMDAERQSEIQVLEQLDNFHLSHSSPSTECDHHHHLHQQQQQPQQRQHQHSYPHPHPHPHVHSHHLHPHQHQHHHQTVEQAPHEIGSASRLPNQSNNPPTSTAAWPEPSRDPDESDPNNMNMAPGHTVPRSAKRKRRGMPGGEANGVVQADPVVPLATGNAGPPSARTALRQLRESATSAVQDKNTGGQIARSLDELERLVTSQVHNQPRPDANPHARNPHPQNDRTPTHSRLPVLRPGARGAGQHGKGHDLSGRIGEPLTERPLLHGQDMHLRSGDEPTRGYPMNDAHAASGTNDHPRAQSHRIAPQGSFALPHGLGAGPGTAGRQDVGNGATSGDSLMNFIMMQMQHMQQQQREQENQRAQAEARQKAILAEVERQTAAVEAESAAMYAELVKLRRRGSVGAANRRFEGPGGPEKAAVEALESVVRHPPHVSVQSKAMLDLSKQHAETMARLQYETERLEKEAALDALRDQLERERQQRKQERVHQGWLEQQKRAIQAVRVQKLMSKEAPELLEDGTATREVHAFPRVQLDFVDQLPSMLKQLELDGQEVRLVFALYDGAPHTGSKQIAKTKATAWTTVDGVRSRTPIGSHAAFSEVVKVPAEAMPGYTEQHTGSVAHMVVEVQMRGRKREGLSSRTGTSERSDAQGPLAHVSLGWVVLNIAHNFPALGHDGQQPKIVQDDGVKASQAPADETAQSVRVKLRVVPGPFPPGGDYEGMYATLEPKQRRALPGVYLQLKGLKEAASARFLVDPMFEFHTYAAPRYKPTFGQQTGHTSGGWNGGAQAQGVPRANGNEARTPRPQAVSSPRGTAEENDDAQRHNTVPPMSPRAPPTPAGNASRLTVRRCAVVLEREGTQRLEECTGSNIGAPEAPAHLHLEALDAQGRCLQSWRGNVSGRGRPRDTLECTPAMELKKQVENLRVKLVCGGVGGPLSRPNSRTSSSSRRSFTSSPAVVLGETTWRVKDFTQQDDEITLKLNARRGDQGRGRSSPMVGIGSLVLTMANTGPDAGGEHPRCTTAQTEKRTEGASNAADGEDDAQLHDPSASHGNSTDHRLSLWRDVDASPKVTLPRPVFEPGHGFDVYIDCAKQLPPSASVTRVSVKLLPPKSASEVAVEHSCLASFDDRQSTVMNPRFQRCLEFRARRFDPRAMLLIRVDTISPKNSSIDDDSDPARTETEPGFELECLGYSLLNVFVETGDSSGAGLQQPTEANSGEYALNTGGFQLPVHQKPPSKATIQACDARGLDHVPRVPCASLLVRIVPAPTSTDGLTTLSRADIPKADWDSHGLTESTVPDDAYDMDFYDTQRCKPTVAERRVYGIRRRWDKADADGGYDRSIADEARDCMALGARQEGHASGGEAITSWLESQFTLKPKRMFEFTRVHPFSQRSGIRVAVDGLINVTGVSASRGRFSRAKAPKYMYKVAYFLMPPGMYLNDPPMTDETHFTRAMDPDSSLDCPRFLDGVNVFKNIPYDPRLTLILQIRAVNVLTPAEAKRNAGAVSEVLQPEHGYWGVLPVFLPHAHLDHRGSLHSVASGTYPVPLFRGTIPREALGLLRASGGSQIYKWFIDQARQATPQGPAFEDSVPCALVRMVDAQLDTEAFRLHRTLHQEMLDCRRQGTSFMPEWKTRWLHQAARTNSDLSHNLDGVRHRVLAAIEENDKKADSLKKHVESTAKATFDDISPKINRDFAKATGVTRYRL